MVGAVAARTVARQNLPCLTAVLMLAMTAVHLLPGVAPVLIYDRTAILAGDWWRLLTAGLVHHSSSHLCWNLAVLGCFGALLERDGRALLAWLLVLNTIGQWLLLLDPGIARFAGASGFATAVVSVLCLKKLAATGGCRFLWIFLLLVLCGKTGYELLVPQALFAEGDFLLLPQAHLLGMVSSILVFVLDPGTGNGSSRKESYLVSG